LEGRHSLFTVAGLRNISNVRAYVAWAAVCIIWGTTFLANGIGIQSMPPLLFGGFRYLTAGLILTGFLHFRKGGTPAPKVSFKLGLAGIAILSLGVGVVIWSQQWIPSGFAALLVAATPFWLVLFEAASKGGERLSWRSILGLLCGFGGIIVIASEQPPGSFRTDYLWAIGAVLLSGLSWSAGSIYTRKNTPEDGGTHVAARQMLFGGVFLLAAGLLTGERIPATVEPRSIVAFVYLVLAGSIVAYVAYLYALRHLPVAFVSTYMYVNPVLALWLGHVILEEPLTTGIAVATMLILAGLLVMQSKPGMKGRISTQPARRLAFRSVTTRPATQQSTSNSVQPAQACRCEAT